MAALVGSAAVTIPASLASVNSLAGVLCLTLSMSVPPQLISCLIATLLTSVASVLQQQARQSRIVRRVRRRGCGPTGDDDDVVPVAEEAPAGSDPALDDGGGTDGNDGTQPPPTVFDPVADLRARLVAALQRSSSTTAASVLLFGASTASGLTPIAAVQLAPTLGALLLPAVMALLKLIQNDAPRAASHRG